MLTDCVVHIRHKVLPMAAIGVHRAAIVSASGLFCGVAPQEVRDRKEKKKNEKIRAIFII